MNSPLEIRKEVKKNSFVEHQIFYPQHVINFLIRLAVKSQTGFDQNLALREMRQPPLKFFVRG